jgi:hypothetical protein
VLDSVEIVFHSCVHGGGRRVGIGSAIDMCDAPHIAARDVHFAV